MAIFKIYLKEENNSEYYDIVKEYNNLMERWNIVNSKIHEFKIPRFFIFKTKKLLKAIKEEGESLQKDFIIWNKKANAFALEPKYKLDSDQVQDLAYLHFTNNMRHLIDFMNNCMVLLTNNFNNRYSQYEEQFNFLIAISAFFIGIISVIFTIFSLFFQDNVKEKLYNLKIPQNIEMNIKNSNKLKTKLDSLLKSNQDNFDSLYFNIKKLSDKNNKIKKK